MVVTWRALEHGGPFFEDWRLRAIGLYNGGPERLGFFHWWDGIYSVSQYRPLSVPYVMVWVGFVGDSPFRHQLWVSVFLALTGFALFAALRVARFPWLFAVVAATLFVAFPFTSSAKFWSTGSIFDFADALVLAGLALGGIVLRHWPARRRWGLLAASVVLFALTAGFYELPLPLLALAPIYYAAACDGWRRAVFVKTGADILAAVVMLAVFRTQGRTETSAADTWWPHARQIVSEACRLFFDALTPSGRWDIAIVVILVAIAAGLGLRFVVEREATLRDLRDARPRFARYAVVGLLGLVAALLAYLFLVPALWYRPLMPGQGDRSNAAAAIGYAVAYTALLAVLATLAACAVPKRRAAIAGFATMSALALVYAGAFAAQSRGQGDLYIKAWQGSHKLEQAMHATLRTPLPPGTLVLSFGSTMYVAPLINQIGDYNDFDAAVKFAVDNGTVRGAAIFAPQPVVCGPTKVELPRRPGIGPLFGPAWRARYGKVIFMQPYEHRTERIDSQAGCQAALTRFTPGPLA
ncbi:hypothetical protein [Candidatus Solirubrobacter pratensis]|uniref:hypothetical protein n=1 Tax=Candidatus Solirubrobacter pratensis TaxID=1298857 RepID=UPI0012DC42FF|nr:hypothetical protein [Candidatus Solirubrobacter pratensis]